MLCYRGTQCTTLNALCQRHYRKGWWWVTVISHARPYQCTPICTSLRAATRIATSYTAGIGVSWVWPIVFLYIPQNGHTIMVDFCHGHRVTHSLAVWSRSHRQLFGRSWSVTMVSALSTVCTEVTTACTCVCVCVCVCVYRCICVCMCAMCTSLLERLLTTPCICVYVGVCVYECTGVTLLVAVRNESYQQVPEYLSGYYMWIGSGLVEV